MRDRVSIMAVLLCLMAWPVLLRGQGQASSPGKVGVINIQEAIGTSAEGKKAFTDLQKKYQPRQQELQRRQQEINALQEQLQKQAVTLSDEERLRLGRELEDKQKIFKRNTEDANADFQVDQQDIIRRIGQKMVRIINEYAPQNGFSLIVEEAQIQPYFLVREIDITEEIVRRFDAANPVEPAGTPALTTPAVPSPTPATRPATPAPRPPAANKPAEKPKP